MPTDLSSIYTGLSMAAVVTAIVAMGGIKLIPNATRWGVNKVAGFFGR